MYFLLHWSHGNYWTGFQSSKFGSSCIKCNGDYYMKLLVRLHYFYRKKKHFLRLLILNEYSVNSVSACAFYLIFLNAEWKKTIRSALEDCIPCRWENIFIHSPWNQKVPSWLQFILLWLNHHQLLINYNNFDIISDKSINNISL